MNTKSSAPQKASFPANPLRLPGRGLLIGFITAAILSPPLWQPAANARETPRISRPTRLPLPVIIDGTPSRDILVLITEDPETDTGRETVRLEARPLLDLLAEQLDPAPLKDFRGKIEEFQEKSWISLRALNGIGLQAIYDPAALEVRILIPAVLRKLNVVSVSRGIPTELNSEMQSPSRLSGYLNASLAEDYQSGRQPARSALDGALNWNNWVLEGQGRLSEGTPHVWQRDDFRLVRDDVEHLIRYSAGDVTYPTRGFQRFVPVGGVSASTAFNLQPNRLFTANGSHEIMLKSRSTVRIWMNGSLIQTLDLPAGRHDIRDFPFSTGTNLIMVEITDDVGRTEYLRFPYVYSDFLLDRGLHELSYTVGAPIRTDTAPGNTGAPRIYDTRHLHASLSHRYGVSNALTAGAYAQGNREQAVYGGNASLGSPAGTWTLEPAGSIQGFQSGAAGRLSYLYSDYRGYRSTQRMLGLGLEGRTRYFATLGELNPDNPFPYEVSMSYSQQAFSWFTASVTARQNLPRAGITALPPRTLSLALARNWASDLDTTLTFSHLRSATSTSETSATFLLVWLLPAHRQYVTATATSAEQATRVEWGTTSSQTVGSANVALGAERSRDRSGFDGRVDYVANRARLLLSHSSSYSQDSRAAHNTGIRLGSALVFVDGAFALSRPVQDSFVMVKPGKSLAKEDVRLNPADELAFEARNDWLGPAVIPDLPSYHPYQLRLLAPTLPVGSAIPRDNYVLMPRYKSGFSIHPGMESTILARGRLLRANGEPLSLVSGEARSLSVPAAAPVMFFTTREGRFSLESLDAGEDAGGNSGDLGANGQYQLEFYDSKYPPIPIRIPKNAKQGIVDLGDLRIDQ